MTERALLLTQRALFLTDVAILVTIRSLSAIEDTFLWSPLLPLPLSQRAGRVSPLVPVPLGEIFSECVVSVNVRMTVCASDRLVHRVESDSVV